MRTHVHIHIHVQTCVYKGFALCSHPVLPSDKCTHHTHVSPLPRCAVRKGQILPIPLSYYTGLPSTALLHPATEDFGLAGMNAGQWGAACWWPCGRWWYWPWMYVVTADREQPFLNWDFPVKRKTQGKPWFLHPFFYRNWCFHLILLFL